MTKSYNSPLEHVDYNAIIDGTKNNGVQSGLAVSERGSGQNMSVDVASGVALINKLSYTEVSTVNVVISAADATHPRKDIIIYDVATTNPAVVTGTPAAEPIPPDITSGDILLAVVNVAANETTIANTDIEDGRVGVDYHHTTHEYGGSDVAGIPAEINVVTGSRALATNYQNAGDSAIFVSVTAAHGTGVQMVAYVKSSSPADVKIAQAFPYPGYYDQVFFIVPAGYYYRVVCSGGAIDVWTEWR